jgi:hypothetical protein
MPFTQSQVFAQVSVILSDIDNVRWPLAELNGYLHRALVYIATEKPSAMAETTFLSLQAGAYQTLPDTWIAMARATRNVGPAPNNTPRAAITAVNRTALDASMPGWSNPAIQPYASTVMHVMADPAEPRDYYVFPGNDGTGRIEVSVVRYPAPLGGAPFSANVPVPDIYFNVVVDLVISFALRKDMALPGSAERAIAHMNEARSALGLKRVNEKITTPRAAYAPEAAQ